METATPNPNERIAYVRANFVRLETACARAGRDLAETYRSIALGFLPRPCYVLGDNAAFVPVCYFDCEINCMQFIERHLAECERLGFASSLTDAAEAWERYLSGLFGFCLRVVTPESIVQAQALMARIEELTRVPRAGDSSWESSLRDAVDQLDQLEMPLSPNFDRTRYARELFRRDRI